MYRSISEYVRNCGPEQPEKKDSYVNTENLEPRLRQVVYNLIEYSHTKQLQYLDSSVWLLNETIKDAVRDST